MSIVEQLVHALVGMQGNAQAALPVVPNNGNPAGANNMPHNGSPDAGGPMPGAGVRDWSKPSASMDNIRQMLDRPIYRAGGLQGYEGPRPGSQEWLDARAHGQHPIMDWLRTHRGMDEDVPMPGNTGIVPPNMMPAPMPQKGNMLYANNTTAPVLPVTADRVMPRNKPVPIVLK